MTFNESIARLYIRLESVHPAIWRRVEIPVTTNLKGVHEIIQAVMLQGDSHAFKFDVEGRCYTVPLLECDLVRETYAAHNLRIGALIDRGISTFRYSRNSRESWQYEIIIEDVATANPSVDYPRFLAGERRVPPDDVERLLGFDEFLEAMADPGHMQHCKVVDWYGGLFEPLEICTGLIDERVAKLALRRRRARARFGKDRMR